MSRSPAGGSPGGTRKDVPALTRGCKILDAVAAANRPLTASVLARELNLPRSTVHGLCATLVNLGLLLRESDNGFRIGPHIMRWTRAFLAQTDLTAEFAALLETLRVLTNETITLSILDGNEVVYIGCRNSPAPLGITFRIGMRLPAAFTATGKAILSTMSDDQVRRIMAGHWPKALTARSVRDIDALLQELDETRRRGFSIDDGQTREDMYCFGTAVLDSGNRVVAGVAVSLLATHVDASSTHLAAQNIRTIARELSIRLGADVGAALTPSTRPKPTQAEPLPRSRAARP